MWPHVPEVDDPCRDREGRPYLCLSPGSWRLDDDGIQAGQLKLTEIVSVFYLQRAESSFTCE